MKILLSILPILTALVTGYILAKLLPKFLISQLTKGITPLIWLMLFVIGFEFGEIAFSLDSATKIIKNAMIFSVLTTLIPITLLYFFIKKQHTKKPFHTINTSTISPVVKELLVALTCVFLGILLFVIMKKIKLEIPLLKSSDLLFLLIILVGIDLSQINWSKNHISFKLLTIPSLVVIGSLIAAFPAAWMSGESLPHSLAFASGFGWFTLSSVMMNEAYGYEYGSMALLTDLFRELIAIVLLYSLGKSHPQIGIASAGATAMDSTLPIIKQTCSLKHTPLALVSGFVLTILSPILISLFISL